MFRREKSQMQLENKRIEMIKNQPQDKRFKRVLLCTDDETGFGMRWGSSEARKEEGGQDKLNTLFNSPHHSSDIESSTSSSPMSSIKGTFLDSRFMCLTLSKYKEFQEIWKRGMKDATPRQAKSHRYTVGVPLETSCKLEGDNNKDRKRNKSDQEIKLQRRNRLQDKNVSRIRKNRKRRKKFLDSLISHRRLRCPWLSWVFFSNHFSLRNYYFTCSLHACCSFFAQESYSPSSHSPWVFHDSRSSRKSWPWIKREDSWTREELKTSLVVQPELKRVKPRLDTEKVDSIYQFAYVMKMSVNQDKLLKFACSRDSRGREGCTISDSCHHGLHVCRSQCSLPSLSHILLLCSTSSSCTFSSSFFLWVW